MRTPDSLFSVVLSNGRKRLFKQAEVKGVFSSSDYKVERSSLPQGMALKFPFLSFIKKINLKKMRILFFFTVMAPMEIPLMQDLVLQDFRCWIEDLFLQLRTLEVVKN